MNIRIRLLNNFVFKVSYMSFTKLELNLRIKYAICDTYFISDQQIKKILINL